MGLSNLKKKPRKFEIDIDPELVEDEVQDVADIYGFVMPDYDAEQFKGELD